MGDLESPQLALGFPRAPNTDMDSFLIGGNGQLVDRLLKSISEPGSTWLYIWGGEGVGKTHLLLAACQKAEEAGQTVCYLSARELAGNAPSALLEFSGADYIALDDIQVLAGAPEWEESLFHFYNRLREKSAGLIISADCSFRRLNILLKDLSSRLAALEAYQIALLTEAEKADFLKMRAHQRGFALNGEVIAYILSRAERHVSALQQVIEQLDLRSLQEKRLITVPFVKKVMGW